MKEIKNEEEKKAFIYKLQALMVKTSIGRPAITKSGKRILQSIKDLMKNEEFVKELSEVAKVYSSQNFSGLHIREWIKTGEEIDVMVSKIAKKFKLPDYPDSPLTKVAIMENPNENFLLRLYGPPDQCQLVHNWYNILNYYRDHMGDDYDAERLSNDFAFPVSIKISPNASMDDVKEFIDANRNHIKKVQDFFKKNVGKATRYRPNEKRDEIIWHRYQEKMPYKYIVDMINDDPQFEDQKVNKKAAQVVVSRLKKRAKN